MSEYLHFKGFIRDVRYRAFLDEPLPIYDFANFDVNSAKSSGLLELAGGQIGYSKWVSPKRTRTYPFARLYNIFNTPLRATVIPVLKDEGLDGDLDRIQYSTISWMNLLNIYVVLTYYATARKNMSAPQAHRHKLTAQKLNANVVQSQLVELGQYKQSALHWNRTLLEKQFVTIYQSALDAYEQISSRTGVAVHPKPAQQGYLGEVLRDFNQFKDISLRGSQSAAAREVRTSHHLEFLSDGAKASFEIENYLGGVYYLTADEVARVGDTLIIQESKNTTMSFLPSLADIKDGLFKLILYANLDTLELNGRPVAFKTRLNLTGKDVRGALRFPCSNIEMQKFVGANSGQIRSRHQSLLEKLNLEAANNRKLEIIVRGNS